MSRDRLELVSSLTQALGQASAHAVVVSQTVAAAVGLNATDLECLDILQNRKLASAGEIAQLTSLTTGAVTALLDRLEKAGFIQRQADPSDRRRVLAAPLPERMVQLFEMYVPLRKAMETLYDDYSDAQLRTFVEFLERSISVSAEFVRALGNRQPVAR
jgi:DNA-binding MarR family transcriptional regulator